MVCLIHGLVLHILSSCNPIAVSETRFRGVDAIVSWW